ncbi:hypothetical protein NM688_g4406 [Phlebia brevispora]|uniref:Uncharacterized protein n=1 Tax=Phlebia brevispora TaxID=194682 RepID=A0ACC1T309_9APHY|nr:hypothetical protein NM688_g4406 [Phlebia brevispora]
MPPWGRVILINRPEWLEYIKQGDVQRYSRGPIAVALFTEFPGRNTPVGSEGAEWRFARRTMAPIFTVKSFTNHVSSAMNEIVPLTRELLSDACQKGVPVDWNDLSGRIAFSIFCKSALDLDTNVLRGDTSCLSCSHPLLDAINVLNRVSSSRILNPLWRWTEKINGVSKKFNAAREQMWRLVDTVIEEQKRMPTKSQDNYLANMLNDPEITNPLLVRDVLVTLLFAGRDNTQNALAWALYALMNNPKWITRMREEAVAYANNDHEVEYHDLAKYPIHLAVFYEVVRLWPGLPKNFRLAMFDDELPAIPHIGQPAVRIDKGDYIFWSDYVMMRDEATWGPTSNDFDPGRHLDREGNFVKPAPPNFIGFGAGPRLCPAAQLVAYEFVACWAGILPYFDFSPMKNVLPDGTRYQEPRLIEAFTPSLSCPLMVDVRKFNDDERTKLGFAA